MRIAVSSDHRGQELRSKVIQLIEHLGHQVKCVGACNGAPVDFFDLSAAVARKVSDGEADRGIMIGEAGLGMSIVAHKFPGVRAALCCDEFTAEMSHRHNDLRVLCLSAETWSECMVSRIVQVRLDTSFEGGRRARRVEKITALERGQ